MDQAQRKAKDPGPRGRKRAPLANRKASARHRPSCSQRIPTYFVPAACPRGRATDAEIEAALTEVPEIGLWTARGFLLIGLDRPDVFISGDLALPRVVQRVCGFDHMPTDEEMTELSDRRRPYRSLAVYYLFASEYDV